MDDGSGCPTSLQQRAALSCSIISSTLPLLAADGRPDVRENLVTVAAIPSATRLKCRNALKLKEHIWILRKGFRVHMVDH